MKKLVMNLMLVFVLGMVLTGCFGDNKVTFINKSSYTISIMPNGQTWSEFDLAPQATKEVNIKKEKEIKYKHNYAPLVKAERINGDNEIYIYDIK